MPIISAIFLSVAAGIVTAIPGIFSEFGKKAPANIPLLVDIKTFWGRKLSRGEVFWLGMFIHLLTAALFGAGYQFLSAHGLVHPYRLGNMLVYASCFYLFIGGVMFPAAGCGLFGSKEGKTVWYELLIVHHLFAVFMWLAIWFWPVLKP